MLPLARRLAVPLVGACGCAAGDVGSTSDAAEVGEVTGATSTSSAGSTSSATSTSASASSTTSDLESSTASTTSTTDGSSESTGGPIDPDLVLWYRFDEDEFAGTVLDATGIHDGSCALERCPAVVPGQIGNAGEFDGSDDIVHVLASDSLQIEGAFTVAAWTRIDAFSADFRTIAAKAVGAEFDDTWELGLPGGTMGLRLQLSTVTGPADVTVGTALGTWIHTAGTWDGATLRLFIDGQPLGESAAVDLVQDEHGISIGGGVDYGVDANFFAGALDEVRIYRRALADDEIAALAMP